MRFQIRFLCAAAVAAMVASPAASQLATTGEADNEARRAWDTGLSMQAGRLHAVRDRLLREFFDAADTTVLDHHRTTAALDAAAFPDLAPAAQTFGIGARVCDSGTAGAVEDDWLIVFYSPVSAEQRRRFPPAEVHLSGHRRPLAVAASSSPQHASDLVWIEGATVGMPGGVAAPAALTACIADLDSAAAGAQTLGADAIPAAIGRVNAPAGERQEQRRRESRYQACPAGEVGAGILQTRRVTTVTDGRGQLLRAGLFPVPAGGAELSPGVVAGPWQQVARLCRPPETGVRTRTDPCTLTVGGHQQTGLRVIRVSWTEVVVPVAGGPDRVEVRETPGTAVEIVPCTWPPPTTWPVDVPVETTTTHPENRPEGCVAVHGSQWTRGSRNWRRFRRETRITWPRGSAADDLKISRSAWRLQLDTCNRLVNRVQTGTRTFSCAEGETGSITQSRTRSWVEVVYARPVPHRSNYALSYGAWSGWSAASGSCVPVTPVNNPDAGSPSGDGGNPPPRQPRQPDRQPDGGGGGGGDDDGAAFWRQDPETKKWYKGKPNNEHVQGERWDGMVSKDCPAPCGSGGGDTSQAYKDRFNERVAKARAEQERQRAARERAQRQRNNDNSGNNNGGGGGGWTPPRRTGRQPGEPAWDPNLCGALC